MRKQNNTPLKWLEGWGMDTFFNSEDYGVLHFYPGDKWALYCKATDMVVAITPGWPMHEDMLGTEVDTPSFWKKLGSCHLDCEEVA